MAENKDKQAKKEEAPEPKKETKAAPAKPEVKTRLVTQGRVAQFKKDGWKETGQASKSGELIEMSK